MKETKHLLIISLILFLVSAGFAGSNNNDDHMAYACSCMQPLSPDEELPKYDVVFSGNVREINKENPLAIGDFSSDSVYVTFDVDREWKGFKAEHLIIEMSDSSASCGFSFEKNQEYIVYATHSEEFPFELLDVNSCSRTGLSQKLLKNLMSWVQEYQSIPK